MSKSGFVTEQGTDKDNEPYQNTYGICLSRRLTSMQVDKSKLQQGFDKAACSDLETMIMSGCKSETLSKAVSKVSMEEVEDEY